MCVKIARGFWKERSTVSSVWSLSYEKSANGPFLFENEPGEAITVNADRYRQLRMFGIL